LGLVGKFKEIQGKGWKQIRVMLFGDQLDLDVRKGEGPLNDEVDEDDESNRALIRDDF
jgi:hypothetical protein